MTTTGSPEQAGHLDIVIPVHNEEGQLERSVSELRAFLESSPFQAWSIVIADNASLDGTWRIAEGLGRTLPGVRAVHLDRKGRGRALNQVWSQSQADVLCYMDVDLSTRLDALLPLVLPLFRDEADLAIGSRLLAESAITRGLRREIISRTYNRIVRTFFRVGFVDAQCGFKAITRAAATNLLADVADTTWFFDSELLLLATYRGYRIREVPVRWVEDPDSRVAIGTTTLEDLRGLWRMRRKLGRERREHRVSERVPLEPAPEGAQPDLRRES